MKVRLHHRIFSLTMAFLLFVSTMGISMDVHYCQDTAQNVAFFKTAKNCYDKVPDINKRPCQLTKSQMESIKKKPCCHNDGDYFKADLEAISQVHDIDVNFSSAVIVQPVLLIEGIVFQKTKAHLLDYKPPLVSKDILTHFQQFLI